MKIWRWMTLLGATAGVAAACGSDDRPEGQQTATATTTGAGAGTSAGGSGAGGHTPDATTGNDAASTSSTGGGAPVCFVQVAAELLPGGVRSGQGGLGLCTEPQVQAYVDQCLSDSADETSCEDFTLGTSDPSTATCFDCLFANADGDDHWPVFLENEFIHVQSYACEAIVQDKPQCAEPIGRLEFCVTTACESCPRSDDGSMLTQEELDQIDACEAEALDLCAPEISIPSECTAIYTSDLDALSTTCQGVEDPANRTFETLAVAAGNVICGAMAGNGN